MAPIRRYLRITRNSAIEVRIYSTNPALSQSWLLSPRNDVLARIITAIRPYVERQLREEDLRVRGKNKKRKGIKDEVHGEDFEVAIFLTDPSTRHSLLLKHKDFQQRRGNIKSNSGRLTGWLTGGQEKAVELDDDDEAGPRSVIRQESDDEAATNLNAYPPAAHDSEAVGAKRSRKTVSEIRDDLDEVSEDEGFLTQQDRQSKRLKAGNYLEDAMDDKKKMNLATSYEGFSIYGRVLCLVVKRKGGNASTVGHQDVLPGESGQQMMENWVSTQATQEVQGVDEE